MDHLYFINYKFKIKVKYLEYIMEFINEIPRIYNVISNFFNILTRKNYFLDNDQIEIFKRKMINSGPLYIKICQIIAQRTDLFQLEENFKKALEELHDNVPHHDFEFTENILEKYNLKDIEFESTTPIGSGAIGQVYKINYQGRKCILKIKHPNNDNLILSNISDFKMIINLAGTLKYDFLNSIDFEYFFETLILQSDFKSEAENCKLMKENFKDFDFVNIPDILYYNNDVIIESFEEGITINNFLLDNTSKNIEVNMKLIIIVLQMIFANRFFHSDCHNGNILVKLDNNKLIFTFIDFGLVSKIDSKNRDIICNMFKASITKNELLFKKCLFESVEGDISYSKFNKIVDIKENLNSKNVTDNFKMIEDLIVGIKKSGVKVNSDIFNAVLTFGLITKDNFDFKNFTIVDLSFYNIVNSDLKCLEKLKKIINRILPDDYFVNTKNEMKLILNKLV